jgi:hypothetical protein
MQYPDFKDGLKDDTEYIFLGDYVDRGNQNAEVMKFMQSIMNRPNVCLLEGNHERWLRDFGEGIQAKSNEFEYKTKPQLIAAGYTPKEARMFYRKLRQMSHFTFNGLEILACHGGIPYLDTNLMYLPTEAFVHGVGTYNDYQTIAETWMTKSKDNQYLVHGHRNTQSDPVQIADRVFNLEGKVEFGGNLRIVEVTQNDGKLSFKCIEIKNDVFDKALKRKEFDTNESVINELENSSLIHKKDLGDGTSSYNFTREAFWDSKWDNLTTTARGLFIDNESQEIVARSYPKFFAIEERPETQWRNLQKNLSFPVALYRKENGYLGIVSSRNGELYICSKSTNKGDYAGWFKDLLYKSVNDIVAFNKYLADNKVSAIFEVIDIEHDPHIIPYMNSHIVLLDVVKNDFNDTFLTFEELGDVAVKFGLEY